MGGMTAVMGGERKTGGRIEMGGRESEEKGKMGREELWEERGRRKGGKKIQEDMNEKRKKRKERIIEMKRKTKKKGKRST